MENQTLSRYTRKIGNVTLVAQCLPLLGNPVQWLLETVSSFAGVGRGLADDVTINIGWSFLKLVKQLDGSLMICEPDFRGNIYNFVPHVTQTLVIIGMQQKVMAGLKYSITPLNTLFNQTMVIQKECLDKKMVYLHRRKPSSNQDSGWYIGPVSPDDQTEEYKVIYSYQLFQANRPALISALLLPIDYVAIFNGDKIIGVSSDRKEEVWQGYK